LPQESGVHATIAGVLLGLLTPARPRLSGNAFAGFVERATEVMLVRALPVPSGAAG
jgi:Na+/H+ antiporter NhaA